MNRLMTNILLNETNVILLFILCISSIILNIILEQDNLKLKNTITKYMLEEEFIDDPVEYDSTEL